MTASHYIADILTRPDLFEAKSAVNVPKYHMIIPNDEASWEAKMAFKQRLLNETDPHLLHISAEIPQDRLVCFFKQLLTTAEADVYRKDLAGSQP